jgi:DNA ligase-1
MKPMLAATLDDVADLKFPAYASTKLDGVRALVSQNGKLLSRSLKPFPNPHVNKLFGRRELAGLDGELILGSPTAADVFRVTSGACQRDTGEPDMKFHVFDRWERQGTFLDWLHSTKLAAKAPVCYVPQYRVENATELLALEEKVLDEGYEGLILRSPTGLYKFGRSTLREQGMLKLKRFTDGEAVVIGVEEELHNANKAKRNELGRTARSSAKAGLVPTGRMGALQVRDMRTGVEFSIGTGFDSEDREAKWPLGGIVKYKSFQVGVKDKPRFPVFLGRRMKEDM